MRKRRRRRTKKYKEEKIKNKDKLEAACFSRNHGVCLPNCVTSYPEMQQIYISISVSNSSEYGSET